VTYCVIISWPISLGFLLSADQALLHESTPSLEHPRNFGRNRGGYGKKWLSAYKSSNISETGQDMTEVTIHDQ